MNKTLSAGSLFLEEFVKRTIIKSLVHPKIEKKEVLLEKLEEVVKAPPRLNIEPKKLKPIKKIEQKPMSLPIHKAPIIQKKSQPAPKAIEIKQRSKLKEVVSKETWFLTKPQISIKPKMPQSPKTPFKPQKPEAAKSAIIDKLGMIFSDSAVQALNCPGPNKNVLITRGGLVQATHISFTKNEIKDFMNDLSERTRIPLIPGLIKVIYQNLLITAVVSEFVSTKFVVERRQQLPMHPPARLQFRRF